MREVGEHITDYRICWNCIYYCTFACLCHKDGKQKDYRKTCEYHKEDGEVKKEDEK